VITTMGTPRGSAASLRHSTQPEPAPDRVRFLNKGNGGLAKAQRGEHVLPLPMPTRHRLATSNPHRTDGARHAQGKLSLYGAPSATVRGRHVRTTAMVIIRQRTASFTMHAFPRTAWSA
jgi:hypothetical protein